jgi:hypothetical protein
MSVDADYSFVGIGDSKSNIYIINFIFFLSYHLIVNLNIANPNSNSLVKPTTRLLEYLTYSPGYNAPVLEVGARARHGEGLACACLAIAHDGAVVALHHGGDCLAC